jgi:hypothetical protein
MLSSLVKEHQAKQASRKEKQGSCDHLGFNCENGCFMKNIGAIF